MPAFLADCYARCMGQRPNKVRMHNSFHQLQILKVFLTGPIVQKSVSCIVRVRVFL